MWPICAESAVKPQPNQPTLTPNPSAISLLQITFRNLQFRKLPTPHLVHIVQTPLIQFAVDLLYSLLYSKSTTDRVSVNGVWAYIGQSVVVNYCFTDVPLSLSPPRRL